MSTRSARRLSRNERLVEPCTEAPVSRSVRNERKNTPYHSGCIGERSVVFLSATFNYGGVGIITGSDDLDRVHVSAPYV